MLSLRGQVDADLAHKVFTVITDGFTQRHSDFVFTFLGHFLSALKKAGTPVSVSQPLIEYLIEKALPKMYGSPSMDEKYCKVNEMLLKISYSILKTTPLNKTTFTVDRQLVLNTRLGESINELMSRYSVNPSILSHIIKLQALKLLATQSLQEVG